MQKTDYNSSEGGIECERNQVSNRFTHLVVFLSISFGLIDKFLLSPEVVDEESGSSGAKLGVLLLIELNQI